MKIWHQSFTVLRDVPLYRDALRAHLRQIVREDTSVELHGLIPGTFSNEYPGGDLSYSFLYWLHGIQWVAAAREAERRGFDAVVLASMSDPMLREIRSIVDIPVVGYGQSAFSCAGYYGRRVGLLVFNAERREFWPDRIQQWGMLERFAGIESAGVTFQDVIAAYNDPIRLQQVVSTVSTHTAQLIRNTGADVIVPAEMPLNLLLAKAGISRIGNASVIDGLAACMRAAEQLSDLKNSSGIGASAQGYFNARPDKRRVSEALSFYGLNDLGKRIPID